MTDNLQSEPSAASRKRCWFCGDPLIGVKSNEHVFPEWLQRELDLESVVIAPKWHSEPLGELLNEREHTWGALKAGRICRKCNNGWMSAMESRTIPDLLPLIRGERPIRDLLAEEKQRVAVWATKTVLTLSAAIQEQRAPDEQYRALFAATDVVPDGIHVFATQHELDLRATYTVDGTWARSRPPATAEEKWLAERYSYKACLQLGRLLLLVVWWPLGPEWILSREENLYELLAPAEAKLLIHPPPDELPDEVKQAAGPDLIAQLETDSGAYALRLTFSVRVFHKADLPDWILQEFGIKPL